MGAERGGDEGSTGIYTLCKMSSSRSSKAYSQQSSMGRNTSSPRMIRRSRFEPAPGRKLELALKNALRCKDLTQNKIFLFSDRHRFWSHESATESLVFYGWTNVQNRDNILDQNFLRNLQGYDADCHRANLKPSVFQLILFAYHTSTVLSPPFWVPLWLLVGIHHVLAYWIAQGLLGYVFVLHNLSRTVLQQNDSIYFMCV